MSDETEGYLDMNVDDLKRKTVPKALYEAVIQSAERRATVYDEKQQEVNWAFRLEGNEDDETNGVLIFQGTNIEKGKGDQFLKFCAVLGFVQDGRVRVRFDENNRIADVENMRVQINVIDKSRKRKGTNEKYMVNEVSDIVKVLPDRA